MRFLCRSTCFLLLALGLICQVIVRQFDYWIRVNDCYVIYNDPTHEQAATLNFQSGQASQPSDLFYVFEYAALDECTVIGRSETLGLFHARDDGSYAICANRAELRQQLAAMGRIEPVPEMRAVSRLDDMVLVRFQIAAILAFALSTTGLIATRQKRSVDPYPTCRDCGYTLATQSPKCPECGVEIFPVIRLRTHERLAPIFIGLGLLILMLYSMLSR